MLFSENINFLNIFQLKQRSRNTLWMERISKLSADSRRSEKMIDGVFLSFSENAILDCANGRKIILEHLSAESAEITRRAALRRSSWRVLSHHVAKLQDSHFLSPSLFTKIGEKRLRLLFCFLFRPLFWSTCSASTFEEASRARFFIDQHKGAKC